MKDYQEQRQIQDKLNES